jgi:hypothetical protein
MPSTVSARGEHAGRVVDEDVDLGKMLTDVLG